QGDSVMARRGTGRLEDLPSYRGVPRGFDCAGRRKRRRRSWLFWIRQIKFPACKPQNVDRSSASASSLISTDAENSSNCSSIRSLTSPIHVTSVGPEKR